MGGVGKKCGFCCSSSASSSSVKLLMFMVVPLIVVSGLFSVLGPLTSNWVVLSNYPWLCGSSTMPPSSPVSSEKESKKRLDFPSQVVVVEVHSMEEATSDDSMLNRSSTPPHAIESIHVQPVRTLAFLPTVQQNGIKEDMRNVSMSGRMSSIVPPMNESHVPNMKARRDYTKLDRLEAGLRRARAAIKEANHGNQTQDNDYAPVGPMYRCANAFYRSYLEMEKQFKIFVYEEGQPPLFIMMNKQFRTRDPDKAHVFFLPFSVTMLVRYVYVRDSHDFSPIKHTVTDYVNLVAGKYPFWNRSLASDHFMLACHDWGPETSRSTPHLHKNSIRVLCNANTSEGFNPTKDVSFPEINLQTGSIQGFIGGPSPSRRPILAFFAGGLHGPIRPVLLEHWENKDEDIRVHRYLPKGISYYDMMRKSKYCICPSGYEVASPRVVEAIYAGCVPVLISDHYVPPFSDVLNWKSFSVEVPVKDVPNLKKILMDISPRQHIRMQRRVVQVRRHFEVHYPPRRFDVFHMILHSVWLRRLNVRFRNDFDVL
ncbi:hypothetical protein I3842_09G006400 [Carya illinoinensis]|uniref:Exostosin GT47 domain-containing protein n=1 Tax=Carya illinoinensis TaxID=32201 RepID=A0A922E1D7_CARIL|nr:hypothetical protein I3842_09G006400 [Carya illinoinensis]